MSMMTKIARPAPRVAHHPCPNPVLGEIARFLAATDTGATRFGLEAIGDPNLVRELRAGRDPSRRVIARIRAYIAEGE